MKLMTQFSLPENIAQFLSVSHSIKIQLICHFYKIKRGIHTKSSGGIGYKEIVENEI